METKRMTVLRLFAAFSSQLTGNWDAIAQAHDELYALHPAALEQNALPPATLALALAKYKFWGGPIPTAMGDYLRDAGIARA